MGLPFLAIKTVGLAKLLNFAKNAPITARKDYDNAIEEAADHLENAVRRDAPVLTGRLRAGFGRSETRPPLVSANPKASAHDNIYEMKRTKKTTEIKIGTRVPYFHRAEMQSSKAGFWRVALEDTRVWLKVRLSKNFRYRG